MEMLINSFPSFFYLEEFDVDLIISFFEGNGMTCEEFIKEVTYSYQDIPVCILSGNKLNANMQQFMNLGVIQYIDKEEVDEALIKYIDNIFKLDLEKILLQN